MRKPVALGVVLAIGALAGGMLWRVSDARSTLAEVDAPVGAIAQTGTVEIGGADIVDGEAVLTAASLSQPENGDDEIMVEGTEEKTLPEGIPLAPVVTEPQPLPQPPARAQNQPAPLPNRGVLHGRADYLVTVPGQEQRPATEAEFWIDLENGDARMSEKEAGSSNEVIRIRRGANQTVMLPADKRARIEIAPDEQAPQLNAIRDGVLSYRMALDQGAFVILGEDSVNGQPVLRVRPTGPGPELADIFLSRDYGLPVKEVTYRPTQAGSREEVQSRVSTYRGVEIVNRSQLAADIFSPSIPSDWESVTTRNLDLAAAGGFRLFDLYWLGTDYSGMSLARMFHDEVVQSSGRVNVVVIDYVQPVTDPQSLASANQIRLVVNQPLSSEELTSRNRGGLPPGAEQVTVNGRRAVVFTPQAPQGGSGSGQPDVNAAQTPPTVLELPMDRALVVIYGKDRAQVTQAARDLQKIN